MLHTFNSKTSHSKIDKIYKYMANDMFKNKGKFVLHKGGRSRTTPVCLYFTVTAIKVTYLRHFDNTDRETSKRYQDQRHKSNTITRIQ